MRREEGGADVGRRRGKIGRKEEMEERDQRREREREREREIKPLSSVVKINESNFSPSKS